MEKVLIPEGGTIPPLIKPRNTQSAKLPCSIFSPLPIYLKPNNATTYQPLRICSAASELTPLLISMKDSKEQVIQVPGGTKKARLANMTDISSPLNDKKVLVTVSKLSSGSSIPSVAGQPQVSHGVVTNARKAVSVGSRRAKTKNKVIHMQQQPVLIQAPGFNHPIIVRQNPMLGSSSPHKVLAVKQEPGITTHQMITVSSNSSLTSTTTTMARPITSPKMSSSSFMVLSNGTRLKVVGKPVPVRLDTNMKNITLSRPPLVMAIPSTSLSSTVATEANPSQNIQSIPSPKKLQAAADPPAYLNIQIKQEPTEVSTTETVYVPGTDIKEEAGNAEKELEEAQQESKFLDIKIKEELKCEESELLASDEQLRKVLGVEEKDCKPNVSVKPKFYIRTAEGKLVAISPEEASALGLNYKDNVGENQKKLTKALRTLQENSTETLKEFVPNYNCLVSEYANPTEFVSRNVPSCLQQNAEVMKNLSGKLVETKCYGKSLLKSNTSVIGEFTQDEQRFLRIEVETQEQVKDLCDVPITPLNMYRCPFCSKDFKTKDHIISHIRVHTGERPYPCDVCGKRYRQRIDIIRHMRIHTGEKPFTCAFCHASFNQKSNLRSHMRVHTGERPVQCRVCGKGFSRNTHLKQHLKLHTGEKPFQCSICFRQFRFKSGLQAHERIHSGLKPYACSKCGRTFTQIVGLIRHTRTHAVEKLYRCQSCGKSFNNCDSYKAHIEIHTSERPYACDLCEKTFTDRAALRCHRKKYHSNMLICMICLREDFKSRIELREHLRAHERENWQETPDGNLVPKLLQGSSNHFVSVDDTVGDLSECEESDEDRQLKESEEIQVEVDLGHDNPIDDDDDDDDDDVKQEDQTNVDSELKSDVKEEDNDVDSDMEERLEIEDKDPLA